MSADTGSRAGELRAIRLVISRELREAFRRKSVWITAGLFLLASTTVVVLPEILGGGETTSERTVAMVGATDGQVPDAFVTAATEIASALDLALEFTAVAEPGEAATRVEGGEFDAAVRFDSEPIVIVVSNDDDQRLIAALRQAVQAATTREALAAANLTDEQIAAVSTPVETVVQVLDTERGGRQAVALGATFVLYLLLVLLAVQVANGVAIEKASRVSEVLLAIVAPRVLLFGKAIGVGLIGVFTLAVGALPIVIRFVAGGSMPPGAGATLVVSAGYSVLGIALYLCLASALGSLVARSEEVSSAVGPLTMILVAGYLLGQAAAGTVVGTALAMFPMTSPVVMPARVALGESSVVEVVVSLGILGASCVIAAQFATVVYRRAIVRTGRRLKLRDVLRAT
jgi:ABC-2 type transport system permease protein